MNNPFGSEEGAKKKKKKGNKTNKAGKWQLKASAEIDSWFEEGIQPPFKKKLMLKCPECKKVRLWVRYEADGITFSVKCKSCGAEPM